jgi:hypothetical protein
MAKGASTKGSFHNKGTGKAISPKISSGKAGAAESAIARAPKIDQKRSSWELPKVKSHGCY